MQTFKRLLVVSLLPILILIASPFSVLADEVYSPDNANKIDPLQTQKQLQGNLSVGEFTGAAIYNYPIALPSGRNGMTPSVSLTYNSQDESLDNILGYHWSVNQYSIKRINKKGVENLYNKNDFIAETPMGSGELVELGGGFYAEKIESTFSKYEFLSDNSWLITAKNGMQYKFGLSDQSRQFDSEDTSRVYQWMLEEIRDPNDNFIRYTYFQADNQIYPKEIIYTGHGQSDGIFKVKFLPFADNQTGSAREDSHYGYNAGFRIATNHLITGIETYADNKLRRKYEIDYTTVNPLIRQTIGSIEETGYDINNSPTSLPPTTFEYSKSVVGWGETTQYQPNWIFESCYNKCESGGPYMWDVTGDGLIDFEYQAYNHVTPGQPLKVRATNNGKGGWIIEDAKFYPNHGAKVPSIQVKPVDFDGDTLIDVIMSGIGLYENGYFGKLSSRIYLATGMNYIDTLSIALGTGIPNLEDYGTAIADLNDDGLPDMIQYGGLKGSTIKNTCLNQNGNSCKLTDLWKAPAVITASGQSTQVRKSYVQDCNYDGLADFMYSGYIGSDSGRWINNGKGGWEKNESDRCHFAMMDSLIERSFDANGDGLIDRIKSFKTITYWGHTITNELRINKGYGLLSNNEIYKGTFPIILGTFGNNYNSSAGVRIFDLNGDKLPDIMQSLSVYDGKGNTTVTKKVYLNTGSRPYFLKTVHTSAGSQIDLEYKTSAQHFKEGGIQANPNLPIIVDTVSKITTNDGMGNSSYINYLYEDGHYYFKDSYDKSYAGFRVVTKTDGLGYKTKTYYHQSEKSIQDSANGEYNDHISKKGRSYRTEVYDNQNQLVQVSINRWDHNQLSQNRYRPFLTQSLTKLLSGTAKSTARSFQYDSYGNVIQSIDYGEVQASGNNGSFTDIGNDLIKTTRSYIQNTVDYLVSLPFESKLFDQGSQLLAHQRLYYDGLSLGEASVGNLTKQESWLDTNNSWITSETDYNAYGLPIRQTNPRGYSITTTYDSHHLYPSTVTNAKGHISLLSFDVGTGQTLTQVDPNNLRSENIYDGLGRLTEAKKTSPITLQMVTVQTATYNDNSMPRSVFTRLHNDDGIEIDSYQYSDGLGRVIQSKQEAPDGKWITSATIYDKRGNVQKNLQTYFSSSKNFESINQNKIGNQFTYDALNRAINVTNPLGTTTNSYNGWDTTVTDPNNNSKTYAYNARNNLVRVDERNNGDTYETFYSYDALNRLIRIRDDNSNTREFSYDSLGRRILQTKLNSQSGWNYEYDVNGNLTKRTDPKEQIAIFTYDELDRVLAENSSLTYTYDQGSNAIGRLSRIDAQNYQHRFIYDLWGRVLQDSKSIRGKDFTFTYTYDQIGGVKEMTYPDNTVVSYSYNNAHLLDEVGGYASNFEYSPLGQITQMELGNGVVTTNTYDPNQMYRLTDKMSSNQLQKYQYTYDSVGNLLLLSDQNSGQTAKTVNYTYDDLYRLTQSDYIQTANQTDITQSYEYDAIGNMMYKSDVGTYSYSSNNPHAVIQAGAQTFAYDENGNMTVRNDTSAPLGTGQNMEYDHRNRMTKNIGKAEFEYGEGYERVTKTDLQTGEIKYYPSKYFEISESLAEEKEVKYIYAGKLRIAKIEKITELQQNLPPADPPVDPDPPTDPPVNPPTPPPVDPPAPPTPPTQLTPYPTYTITNNTGREVEVQTGSYRSMEHLEQMASIQKGQKLALDEVEINRTESVNGISNIPKDLWPEVESDVEFKNLRIEYHETKSVITWNNMDKEAVRFHIYRSKEPYPQKLSKHASQLVAETRASSARNKFIDEDIKSGEKYTYRVVALNKNGQIIKTNIQLNAKQIFIEGGYKNTVDFENYFEENFDKVRAGKNENLIIKPNGSPKKLDVTTNNGFNGHTEIQARFLNCEIKKDGSEYCTKIGSETLDVFVISNKITKPTEIYKLGARIQRLFAGLIPTAYADDETTTYYFLTDHLGSTDVVLDEEGNVVERADYLPFGSDRVRVTEIDAPDTDYKFTGQEKDDETGLHYYVARYYDSEVGRFVSEDPWEGDLTNPQTLNKYGYVLNNPIRYVDPTGEKVSEYQPYSASGSAYVLGELLGTYRGIEIKSAAEQTGSDDHKYQCVSLAKDFALSQYNVNLNYTGNGVDYGNQDRLNSSFQDNNKDNPGSYVAYQNSGTVMPQENDIISWSGGSWGHVGFIAEVTFEEDLGTGMVYTIEQNASPDEGLFYQSLTRTYSDQGQAVYTIGGREDLPGFQVKAWARYENQSMSNPEEYTSTPHSPATQTSADDDNQS